MVQLLPLAESRITDVETFEDRERWVMAGAYFCFCYVVSLRSPEGLMSDLEGLIRYHNASDDFVNIPLKDNKSKVKITPVITFSTRSTSRILASMCELGFEG